MSVRAAILLVTASACGAICALLGSDAGVFLCGIGFGGGVVAAASAMRES